MDSLKEEELKFDTPDVLTTNTTNVISIEFNKNKRLTPDGFKQIQAVVDTFSDINEKTPEGTSASDIDVVELAQLAESASVASNILDRSAAFLRKGHTSSKVEGEDNQRVRDEARELSSEFGSYAGVLNSELKNRKGEKAEASETSKARKIATEGAAAAAAFVGGIGGALSNPYVRTVDQVFPGQNRQDTQNAETDQRPVNVSTLRNAVAIAKNLQNSRPQGMFRQDGGDHPSDNPDFEKALEAAKLVIVPVVAVNASHSADVSAVFNESSNAGKPLQIDKLVSVLIDSGSKDAKEVFDNVNSDISYLIESGVVKDGDITESVSVQTDPDGNTYISPLMIVQKDITIDGQKYEAGSVLTRDTTKKEKAFTGMVNRGDGTEVFPYTFVDKNGQVSSVLVRFLRVEIPGEPTLNYPMSVLYNNGTETKEQDLENGSVNKDTTVILATGESIKISKDTEFAIVGRTNDGYLIGLAKREPGAQSVTGYLKVDDLTTKGVNLSGLKLQPVSTGGAASSKATPSFNVFRTAFTLKTDNGAQKPELSKLPAENELKNVEVTYDLNKIKDPDTRQYVKDILENPKVGKITIKLQKYVKESFYVNQQSESGDIEYLMTFTSDGVDIVVAPTPKAALNPNWVSIEISRLVIAGALQKIEQNLVGITTANTKVEDDSERIYQYRFDNDGHLKDTNNKYLSIAVFRQK